MTENEIAICNVIIDRYNDGELCWAEAEQMLYDNGYYNYIYDED